MNRQFFKVYLSDDNDEDGPNKLDNLSLGKFDRRNSFGMKDQSNCKNDHDYEIGYYMNLTDDDIHIQPENIDKSRVIEIL